MTRSMVVGSGKTIPRKVRVEYPGDIYHIIEPRRSAGGHLSRRGGSSGFPQNPRRSLLTGGLSGACNWRIANRLRKEMILSIKAIAEQLHLGSPRVTEHDCESPKRRKSDGEKGNRMQRRKRTHIKMCVCSSLRPIRGAHEASARNGLPSGNGLDLVEKKHHRLRRADERGRKQAQMRIRNHSEPGRLQRSQNHFVKNGLD